MGIPSISNQVNSALNLVVMNEAEIVAYKAEHHVDSVKKALRPNGKPNRRLPVILGKRTKSGYLETCTKFFERARELTGKKLLAGLFTVELPADLVEQLNESKEYLFTPNQAWKSKFYQAVRKAARALGIKISGLHRLRSNYAQEKYTKLRAKGLTDRQARQKIARELGHNRIDVVKGYIPL
ncbi:MAG: hypothetical protein NT121_20100 [Chloroflexi bacterium]|nr:hypothetical protein [Chloroflexota bacterium]